MVCTQRRATYTVEEAAERLGISRWLAYQQAQRGTLAGVPVIRVGRRLLVPRRALERLLAGELEEGRDGAQ